MNETASRFEAITSAIRETALAADRNPDSIRLVAVSKYQAPEKIAAAYEWGHRDFGENYAQELRDKAKVLRGGIRWHFIGPLQENKVRYVVGTASLIHAVDREKILRAIDARAARLGIVQDVLLEVNIGRDPAKHGLDPADVPAFLELFRDTPHTRCLGLMTIPPVEDDSERTRAHFRNMHNLMESLKKIESGNVLMQELSMGMTGDFRIAIEEGATIVRIGTALFGPRTGQRPKIDTGRVVIP